MFESCTFKSWSPSPLVTPIVAMTRAWKQRKKPVIALFWEAGVYVKAVTSNCTNKSYSKAHFTCLLDCMKGQVGTYEEVTPHLDYLYAGYPPQQTHDQHLLGGGLLSYSYIEFPTWHIQGSCPMLESLHPRKTTPLSLILCWLGSVPTTKRQLACEPKQVESCSHHHSHQYKGVLVTTAIQSYRSSAGSRSGLKLQTSVFRATATPSKTACIPDPEICGYISRAHILS